MNIRIYSIFFSTPFCSLSYRTLPYPLAPKNVMHVFYRNRSFSVSYSFLNVNLFKKLGLLIDHQKSTDYPLAIKNFFFKFSYRWSQKIFFQLELIEKIFRKTSNSFEQFRQKNRKKRPITVTVRFYRFTFALF